MVEIHITQYHRYKYYYGSKAIIYGYTTNFQFATLIQEENKTEWIQLFTPNARILYNCNHAQSHNCS